MKFNNAKDYKTYFQTLNEAKSFRPNLWNKVESCLESLEQDLFDDFNIEDSIYIMNNFFDKSIYSLNNVDVILELNNADVEEVFEAKSIQAHEHNNITYHIYDKDSNRFYTFKDNYFKEESLVIDVKKAYGS